MSQNQKNKHINNHNQNYGQKRKALSKFRKVKKLKLKDRDK